MGPGARLRGRALDRARDGGDAGDRGGDFISGAASDGGARVDRSGVGALGEQPAGEVLHADGAGACAFAGAVGELAAVCEGGGLAAGSSGGRRGLMSESPRWRRYLRLFGPNPEADIEDEVRHHVAALTEHYIARGISPEEARTLAMRRFGDVGAVKTDCVRIAQRRRKAMARAELIDRLGQDVRFAVRTFMRTPVFTAAALLTLGLGIGANTAVFSVVNAVLLRPLPLSDADGLISVWTRYVPESGMDFEFFSVAVPEYREYKAATRVLSDVAAYGFERVNLADSGAPDRVVSIPATANLFDVLRVEPALGRTFRAGEDAAGAPCVGVISDGLWRARFAKRPSVLGETIRVDGRPCTVIGVMPPGFFFPVQDAQLWTPLALDADVELAQQRDSHWISAVGRLRDGATLDQAEAELAPMMTAWRQEYPHHKGHFIVLQPFREDLVGDERPVLVVMLGGVALVLLIICANLANLLLARAEGRRREIAVRVAMGAGRSRLIRQMLTESLILSGAGGLAALVIAPLFLSILGQLDVRTLPAAIGPIDIDPTVMAYTLLLSVLTGVIFGLIPVFQL